MQLCLGYVESGQRRSLKQCLVKTLEALKYKGKGGLFRSLLFSEPGGIRTHDLLIRSQTLYPAELRAENSPSERRLQS